MAPFDVMSTWVDLGRGESSRSVSTVRWLMLFGMRPEVTMSLPDAVCFDHEMLTGRETSKSQVVPLLLYDTGPRGLCS